MWNPHKIKRRIKRHYSHKRLRLRVARSRDAAALPRDIAWQGSVRNPYKRVERESRKRRGLYSFGFSMAAVTATALILLFHPFFQVSSISIGGAERVSADQIKSVIQTAWQERIWRILPSRNYFILNSENLANSIQKSFPVAVVEIKKEFPHKIMLTIAEKPASLIYDDGKRQALLASDGGIIELNGEYSTSTPQDATYDDKADQMQLRFGSFPVVLDNRVRSKINALNAPLSSVITKGLVLWHKAVGVHTNLKDSYIELFDDESAVIHTKKGIELRIMVASDADRQIGRIAAILKDKKNKPQQYIDARYPGRIYWQ